MLKCSVLGALGAQFQDRVQMPCTFRSDHSGCSIGVKSVCVCCRCADADLCGVWRSVPHPRGLGGSAQQLVHRATISPLPGRGTHVLAGTVHTWSGGSLLQGKLATSGIGPVRVGGFLEKL
jgi:hypothetical protein